jgi:hypothetical protein
VEEKLTAPEASCSAFLRAAAAGAAELPAGLQADALLDGLSTKNAVETAIGLHADPDPGGGGGGGGVATPNVDLDGDGINDFHVDSITRRGLVSAIVLNVRARPGLGEAIVDQLPIGARVIAIGTSGDWYAIEHGAGTAFVHKDWVHLQ